MIHMKKLIMVFQWDQPALVVVVYDVTDETSFSSCVKWLERVRTQAPNVNIPGEFCVQVFMIDIPSHFCVQVFMTDIPSHFCVQVFMIDILVSSVYRYL